MNTGRELRVRTTGVCTVLLMGWIGSSRAAPPAAAPGPAGAGVTVSGDPAACGSTVAPAGIQAISGMEFGITPPPLPLSYTITNTGSGGIDYSVSEVDGLLQPSLYAWLALDGSSGNIPAGSGSTVTATANTVGLGAGSYTAFLKFSSGCADPPPCMADAFDYETGTALVGNSGWSAGNATVTDIVVDNGTVKLVGGGTQATGDLDAIYPMNCGGPGSVIILRIKIRGGTAGSNLWGVELVDPAGKSLGRFYGSPLVAAGRIGGYSVGGEWITSNYPLSGPGAWDTLEMRVYTLSNRTACYFNGNLMSRRAGDPDWRDGDGILDHTVTGASDTAGGARLFRIYNSGASEPVYLDDLSVGVSSDSMSRIDLTAVGCDIRVQEPRTRATWGCGSTAVTTESFTIKNIGAYDWVAYQATEFNDDDDWLTLSYSSGPVPRGGTAQVTATINWSLVPSESPADDQIGVIRFSASCDGTHFVHDTPADTIVVAAPPAQFIQYNGDVPPDQPDSGGLGSGISFSLVNDGSIAQGEIVSDPAAVDGLAYRLADTSASKTKWRSVPGATIDPRAGATIVARMKTVSDNDSPGSNLAIYDQVLSTALYWSGSTGVLQETDRGSRVTLAGDNKYRYVRLTALDEGESQGIVIRGYLDEQPDPVLVLSNAAATNSLPGIESFGFGAGSTAASQEIYFDCVWATNAGAFAPNEETACLGRSLKCDSPCNLPAADTDGDSDVDMADFAELQRCITIGAAAAPPLPQVCSCLDRNHDDRIDMTDIAIFVRCASGPDVAWDPSVNCPN